MDLDKNIAKNNIFERIKCKILKIFNKFSYSTRKNKKLKLYKEKLKEIRSLEDDEFNFEYINLKTIYEKKKMILSLILITITISIFTGLWSKILSVIEKIVTLYNDNKLNTDNLKVLSYLFISTGLVISVTIFVSLIVYIKNYIKIYRELLIYEELKYMKN